MLSKSTNFLEILSDYDFKYIAISGASYPSSVAEAIDDHDTDGPVLRKEMVVWQTLRKMFPNVKLKFADHGQDIQLQKSRLLINIRMEKLSTL
jgi:hypothetical protein